MDSVPEGCHLAPRLPTPNVSRGDPRAQHMHQCISLRAMKSLVILYGCFMNQSEFASYMKLVILNSLLVVPSRF